MAEAFSRREAVKVRMGSESSSESSAAAAAVSESSSESESSAPPPRAEMLSRSSLEVNAPSRVSAENEEGGNGGAWSSGGSLRLWMEDVAEEWDGEGDCELRERFGAVRCEECVSIFFYSLGTERFGELGFCR